MFWKLYEQRYGALPGKDPATYWRPVLGHYFHLRPSDLGDLTPRQLMDCWDAMPKDTNG